MAEEWYYLNNNEKVGPVSAARLKKLAATGEIKPSDLVWKEGLADWVEAKRLKGLFPVAKSAPPPIPKSHHEVPATQMRPPTADASKRISKTNEDKEVVEVWNPNAASSWSLLFSATFGSYLHALNWKALGFNKKAKASMMWFYISIIILTICIIVPLINTSDTNYVTPILFWYLVIWYFTSGRSQAKYLKKEFGKNYKKKSWSKPLLIAFAALVGYAVVGSAVSYVSSTNQILESNQAVAMVKGGVLSTCQGHTVEQMVNGFFDSPSWESGVGKMVLNS